MKYLPLLLIFTTPVAHAQLVIGSPGMVSIETDERCQIVVGTRYTTDTCVQRPMLKGGLEVWECDTKVEVICHPATLLDFLEPKR